MNKIIINGDPFKNIYEVSIMINDKIVNTYSTDIEGTPILALKLAKENNISNIGLRGQTAYLQMVSRKMIDMSNGYYIQFEILGG